MEEPAVDQWEAGKLYPTWGQVLALATLTGFPVQFFTEPVKGEGIAAKDTSMRFHVPPGTLDDEPRPVLAFKPEAIRARLGHEGKPAGEIRPVKALAAENHLLRRRFDTAANWLGVLDQITAELDATGQQLQARKLRQAASGLRAAIEGPQRPGGPPGKRA